MSAEPLPCNLKEQDSRAGCDPSLIVETLCDDDARELFFRLEESMTASELDETCDIPTSTLYRKLGILDDAGLVGPVSEDPSPPIEYEKMMDCVSIIYDEPMQIECVKRGVTLHCEL